ncbi:MAG: hypothetical protein RL026_149 [Pseudomonadota bacterium]
MATPVHDSPPRLERAAGPRFAVGLGVSGSSVAEDAYASIAERMRQLSPDGPDAALLPLLAALRDCAGADMAFFLPVGPSRGHYGQPVAALDEAEPCDPAGLAGKPLEILPWLAGRNSPLQLTGIADTWNAAPGQQIDAAAWRACQAGSVLLAACAADGRHVGWLGLGRRQVSTVWDGSPRHGLVLLAASLGAALERAALEARLQQLQLGVELAEDCAREGSWDFNVDRHETRFSQAWLTMLGYRADELAGAVDWRALVHPDEMQQVHEAMRTHVAGQTPRFESEHRMRHRDGSWRWVRSRARAVTDATGRLRRLVAVEADITVQRTYEEALFREKECAQVVLQAVGDGVITADADGLIDFINPVACRMTGWRLEEAMGQPVDAVFRVCHEESCEPLENPVVAAIRRLRQSRSMRPERLVRSDGQDLFVRCTAAPLLDGMGIVTGGVLVFRDVSESRELNHRLDYQASHDTLTGLVNRREFESRLERVLHSARAGEASYAVLYIDLDQFRIVNDGCGHVAGDALLVQVGALLKQRIRWRDTLARLGGDEFCVLLEACGLDEAMRTAEILRKAVEDFRFEWEEQAFRLGGASIGVVPVTADNENVSAVIAAAEAACAGAKQQGRNRVHSFAENDVELMRRRREMHWAARIQAALEEGRFELYGMPIQALQADEPGRHIELLLRLADEQGRVVSPDDFIAAAERYGMMPKIDRWVIEHAFRWLAADTAARESLGVCAINLSGQSLSDESFLPWVLGQLQRSGLDPSLLCFEITETAAVADINRARDFIHRLRELGCSFSLDDFGSGLSSFGYLKHFPVDYLKIDGRFVKEILQDRIDCEMVRAITQIGHITGKRVIAEFAENAAVIELLRELKVDYAQGYGVARPERVYRTTAG